MSNEPWADVAFRHKFFLLPFFLPTGSRSSIDTNEQIGSALEVGPGQSIGTYLEHSRSGALQCVLHSFDLTEFVVPSPLRTPQHAQFIFFRRSSEVGCTRVVLLCVTLGQYCNLIPEKNLTHNNVRITSKKNSRHAKMPRILMLRNVVECLVVTQKLEPYYCVPIF